eukprot:g12937.t1
MNAPTSAGSLNAGLASGCSGIGTGAGTATTKRSAASSTSHMYTAFNGNKHLKMNYYGGMDIVPHTPPPSPEKAMLRRGSRSPVIVGRNAAVRQLDDVSDAEMMANFLASFSHNTLSRFEHRSMSPAVDRDNFPARKRPLNTRSPPNSKSPFAPRQNNTPMSRTFHSGFGVPSANANASANTGGGGKWTLPQSTTGCSRVVHFAEPASPSPDKMKDGPSGGSGDAEPASKKKRLLIRMPSMQLPEAGSGSGNAEDAASRSTSNHGQPRLFRTGSCDSNGMDVDSGALPGPSDGSNYNYSIQNRAEGSGSSRAAMQQTPDVEPKRKARGFEKRKYTPAPSRGDDPVSGLKTLYLAGDAGAWPS